MEILEDTICRTCQVVKPLTEFRKAPSNATGVTLDCKICYKVKESKYQSDYRDNNREKYKRFDKKWKADNIHYVNEKSARNRAKKRKASIGYESFKNELRLIYRNCPKGHEVDHVVPLNGKEVCGLHVPWNLQYLTPEDNIKKSNKLLTTIDEDKPNLIESSGSNNKAVNGSSQFLTSEKICL